MNQIEISCYPTDVPEQIELDIENLELNSSLSVSDLDVGSEDVDVISDANLNIVSVTPPAAEEEVLEEDESSVEGEEDEESSEEKTDEPSSDDSDGNADKG